MLKALIFADLRLFTTKILLISLAAFSNGAQALDLSSDAPIHIKSNRAELDEQKGISIYIGKVTIQQGPSNLEASSVTVHTDDNGIGKVVANGAPAHLVQRDKKGKETHAYGKTIIYSRDNNEIKLIDNAKLVQENNSFQGDIIEYDTVERTVKASTDEGKGDAQQVEMIIYPKKTDEQ